jgi:hypothetical protein
MPVFALANAGVILSPGAFSEPVALAIAGALVFGKPAGVVGFAWLATRAGVARPPPGLSLGRARGGRDADRDRLHDVAVRRRPRLRAPSAAPRRRSACSAARPSPRPPACSRFCSPPVRAARAIRAAPTRSGERA